MPEEAALRHQYNKSSCVLFESPDKSIVLIDIPRSIEEAQVSRGQPIERHIISCTPVPTPWAIPEPKNTDTGQLTSPSAAIAELMTLETVKAAHREAKQNYEGPWCLPRISREYDKVSSDESHPHLTATLKRKKAPQKSETTEEIVSEPFIPAQSHYLQGTIQAQRAAFLANAPTFDLIVLDPPWPSRSVKRKKNSYATVYTMHGARDLLAQIPIASHLKPDGLVTIWVTNRAAITDLLTSPGGVFSEWGVELIGEIVWLKITNFGDPVFDIESRFRKPYERLLIARRRGSTAKVSIPTKVIMGVPDVHSRKPNLKPLFEGVLPQNYSGLEVFARNLTAGWWSWGNEVLYFQQKHHWVDALDNIEEGI
ncbi:MT-A70-domain-containing protein [Hypoxylon fragiforme]|uniref:MT-A70-domain-containing protein n=1 Tax=Hypoxylon fragiforme TaxID=63214 RepID=UPI0020C65DAF|nr:MT-A70-domain-containing protein [Hypoxylon fragiforme]KAI2607569.1 MT-A70-domain-containing protein [Hypoxylon fragiforme]